MGETFYSALGVRANADTKAIRDAYRSEVKERHPDVSDDPDAPREFKRLTTARDVLTDEDERARYDRLGHATYVSRHVDTSVWTVEDETHAGVAGSSRGPGGRSGAAGQRTRTDAAARPNGRESRAKSAGWATASRRRSRYRRTTGTEDRSAWLGEDWDGPRNRRGHNQRARHTAPRWSRQDSDTRDAAGPDAGQVGRSDSQTGTTRPGTGDGSRRGHAETEAVTDGHTDPDTDSDPGVSADWQQASAVYDVTPGATEVYGQRNTQAIFQTARTVGPWLVVHLVLFVCALAMAWYLYEAMVAVSAYSLPAVAFFGIVLVGLMVFISVLHMVSLVYS